MKLRKKNFLDLEKEFSNLEKSKIIIIPFGLEVSVSYGRGTKRGPQAIIQASQEVELFDEEIKKQIYQEVGIATLEEIKVTKNTKGAISQLKKIVENVLALGKIPIILGGEHALTLGAFQPFLKREKPLTIVQFDAHADLRNSLDGDKNSHAAVMRRCLEFSPDIDLVQIGIRNISNEEKDGKEYEFWRKNQDRIKTFWARDAQKWDLKEIINSCGERIYLSFDVDVFDSGLMPSTGTPEPGGLNWYQVLEILKAIAENKKIIGADFVELAPIKGFNAPDFMIAKLIYKFIGYLKGFV